MHFGVRRQRSTSAGSFIPSDALAGEARPATMRSSVRRLSAAGVTRRKVSEIEEVARRFVRARDRYLRAFWDPRHAGLVLTGPRRLPEHLRGTGWGPTGLSARYSELAAKRAAMIIRSGWRAAIVSTRRELTRQPGFTITDRAWIRRVLARPSLVAAVLGRSPLDLTELPDVRQQDRLERWVRRALLRHRPNQPRRSRRRWLDLDGGLYRVFRRPNDKKFRGAWIAISGLRPLQRICLPLAGSDLEDFAPHATAPSGHRPDLYVSFHDGRIAFHVLRHVRTKTPTGSLDAGVDKGYRDLLTLSFGDPARATVYGAGSFRDIAAAADRAAELGRNRRRVRAYERSVRNSDASKARRIRRASLGDRKAKRRAMASRSFLQDAVNRAINQMFHAHPDLARLHVERLDFYKRRLARATNRRLNRWLKGYLHRRLAHKAELNGVELNVVNAAWTSLTCPRCWFPSKKNRHAERFVCRSCGFTGSADAVAATNVLRRGSDPALTRWTSSDEVKRILEGRWRSALNGSAWGLRGSEDVSGRQAANNWGLARDDTSPSHSSTDAVSAEEQVQLGSSPA